MKNAWLSHLTPFAKIVFVLMLIIIGLMLALIAGIGLAMAQCGGDMAKAIQLLSDSGDPATIPLLKGLQIIQSILLFIIPALVAALLFNRDVSGYFGLNRSNPVTIFFFIFIIMIVSMPIINWMVSVNEMMKLPAALSGIEKWMKDAEDQAAQITEQFLDVHTLGGFAVNMFMIAVIPAIGEELLFRGVFQRLFGEWFRNIHIGIFVSALLFAAVHLQFYGFLPRMMLGVMFGYIYVWTRSIWAPMLAHFLNNGAAVAVSYLSNKGLIRANYDTFGSTDNAFLIIGSAVFTGMLLYAVFIFSRKRETSLPS
jgi:uncharacterized protein